jgi:hypothetical protein
LLQLQHSLHCHFDAKNFWPIEITPATPSQVLSTYGHSVVITLKEFAYHLNEIGNVQGLLNEDNDSGFFV